MTKKPPFIQYWFVWNGWSNVRGRMAKCCKSCIHHGEKECTEGMCDYCKLQDIQVQTELVCDKHEWNLEKSIWDE
jgi:hypothetical protein